jgi:hypothetical protein
MTGCEAISCPRPFCSNNNNSKGTFASNTKEASLQNAGIKAKSFTSTPTHRGDNFCAELAESRRFGSLGFSLTFKGLLLGGQAFTCR